jgi:hypothetical protein
MLHDGRGSGDAGVEKLAEQDFGARQEHHDGQRGHDERVFGMTQPAAPASG